MNWAQDRRFEKQTVAVMSTQATCCTLDPSRKPGSHLPRAMLLGFLALWIGICPTRAQLTRFQNFKGEQGLGNPAVEALAQDRDGFILLGTQAGLYRHDGAGILPHAPEVLSEAYVLKVISDKAGRLWVVTNHGIFVRFQSTFSGIDTGRAPIHLRSAHLFAVMGNSAVLDLDGTVLRAPIGAGGVGPFEPLFDATTLRRIPALGKAGFVAPDAHGALLVGCGVAICRVADDGRVTVLGAADGLPVDTWQVALRTPDDTLWARSLDRLARRGPVQDHGRAGRRRSRPGRDGPPLSPSRGRAAEQPDRGPHARSRGIGLGREPRQGGVPQHRPRRLGTLDGG